MTELGKVLPITVVAAIILFFIKEVFEFFKKRAEKKRKVSAYKILLAEEMAKNSWSIFGLRRIVERLQDHSLVHEVIRGADGACHLKSSRDEEVVKGIVLPFHSSIFDKHIVDLAVIDKKFFTQLRDTYQAIADAKVSRSTMLEMCEDQNLKFFLTPIFKES
ncbi:hypothetical protein [Pseudomonas monsensis]|uniref:hypothetical protein n=1 Tax=Pseudomonas monsensis TaxID=2745509 RepID=UPI002ABAD75D|nr:hypothetical protein [Pseudomonas monsensis]MDZ3825873.1 hypothetical protein [Pseudomonas monsensis]